jgi:hypothetical protein
MTNSPSRWNRWTRAACFAGLALVTPLVLAAHFASARSDSEIGVHDGRYVFGGRTYSSLDAVEAGVRASRPATLLILSCTPAATRSWLAAVPRFDDLPMHLDVSNGSSTACEAAIPVSASSGSASAGVEPAVQEYWDRRMP